MNNIQVFNNEELGCIRTVMINDQPWFVGKDIAVALGYSNPQKAIRDHIDVEDKTVNDSFTINGTKGTLINESGLYSLILSSKLPSAKKFKRWVTSEVLPSIRKTGHMVFNWFKWEKDGKEIPKIHPAQKPINVIEQLIKTFTDPGDVVVDPCCGSGTTLRASRNLGRSSFGFEIDRNFYTRAKEEMLRI
jgi:prophage antirepressor-like protein